MKKIKLAQLVLFLPALLLLAITAKAQQLPDVQLSGLRAPANIKIDGKPAEWNNKFQAYNNATGIFYTMANDDKNLYLTVQASDIDIFNRIMGGAITLTIQTPAKNNIGGNIVLTFPVIAPHNGFAFNLYDKKGVEKDTSAKTADSIMRYNNNGLVTKWKWLKVVGIDGLDEGLDSIISVDNQYAIKTAQQFDNKRVYTFELALPLKYLKLSITDAAKFSYHIRVNGQKPVTIWVEPGPNPTPEKIAQAQKATEQAMLRVAKLSAPADIWGEYTLAKNN